MRTIDPIVVKEERDRIDQKTTALTAGRKAADALLWFQEYAIDRDVCTVLKTKVELIASGTFNVSFAQQYITDAAKLYTADILVAAITQAQNDFDVARKIKP